MVELTYTAQRNREILTKLLSASVIKVRSCGATLGRVIVCMLPLTIGDPFLVVRLCDLIAVRRLLLSTTVIIIVIFPVNLINTHSPLVPRGCLKLASFIVITTFREVVIPVIVFIVSNLRLRSLMLLWHCSSYYLFRLLKLWRGRRTCLRVSWKGVVILVVPPVSFIFPWTLKGHCSATVILTCRRIVIGVLVVSHYIK
jgi:hypothetical protein